MSIQKLREERNAKATEYRNILDGIPKENQVSEEDSKKLSDLEAQISAIDNRIDLEQKALDLAAENLATENFAEGLKGKTADNQARSLLNKWMAHGDKGMTADDWQAIRNTMSTTTDAEGGYTVDEDLARSVLEVMKAFGGMRDVATILPTKDGSLMNYPTSDATSEEGEIVGENVAVDDEDFSFGIKSLGVYKYSSKAVAVPFELLQDSVIDLDSYINNRLAQRLHRITNKHYTVGTGTAQPKGMIAAASVGKTGATGQVDSILYNDFVDLEHSVDPAYRVSGCRWMFNDAVLKIVKKLKDDNGRPLWLPDIIGGAPASILNHPYTINQHMATPAAAAKTIAFGDMSKYVIRDVMQITYFRFTDSAYTKKGQVGFLAFMRTGGDLMDVGGAVKVFQHGAAS